MIHLPAALGLGRVLAPPTNLLLDDVPGAVAAFSTHKLRNGYAGPCLRVRRPSDNAEQDIGFSGELLDTASLLSFVGAQDGFVVTWYDQSTNLNDATQTVATNQPKIAVAGALAGTDPAGYPALAFNGTSTALDFNGAVGALSGDDVPNSIFLKFSANNTAASYDIVGFVHTSTTNQRHMLRLNASNGRFVVFRGWSASLLSVTGDLAASGAGWDLFAQVFAGTTVSWWVDFLQDKNAASLDVGTTAFNWAALGARRGGSTYSGYLPGLISGFAVYNTALGTTDRQNWELNL